jgi:hypothetical protein
VKVGSAFPSKYLKANDLGEARLVVTISHVTTEAIGQDSKDKKPVVYFKGKEKGLALNKTNANTITKILGTDETDDWSGGQIGIYQTETDYQGDRVACIRVFAPPKGGKKAAQRPEPEEAPRSEEAEEVPF